MSISFNQIDYSEFLLDQHDETMLKINTLQQINSVYLTEEEQSKIVKKIEDLVQQLYYIITEMNSLQIQS